MTTACGADAPAGYLWARDTGSRWHALRIAGLTDQHGAYRRLVQAACGEWASVLPRTPGHWAALSPRLPAHPDLCARCLEAEPELEESLLMAYVAPAVEQGRLF